MLVCRKSFSASCSTNSLRRKFSITSVINDTVRAKKKIKETVGIMTKFKYYDILAHLFSRKEEKA
jgi:hypothetical protein